MNRQLKSTTSLLLATVILATGCQPQQPFFFSGNDCGDLHHYVDVATDIDYPNVQTTSLDEVTQARSPLTLANAEDFEMWDLTLEEVTRITLANSQVIRNLGGRIVDQTNISSSSPESLTNAPSNATSTYDPALVESGNGVSTGSPLSGTGVEAALSEFDATLDSSVVWQKNDRPQNFGAVFATDYQQDLSNFTFGIMKTAADGTTFEFRHNVNYDANNNTGIRLAPSDWSTNLEAGFVRPLLQGAGTQYNRIAGPQPFANQAANSMNQIDGVMIARIREDITLAQFEAGVSNLMRDVEDAYWELYFAYRDLEAQKVGRDSALETWRKVKALQRVGSQGGEADREAQSRSQYYLFRAQVESRLTFLFRVENRLRYMMGLTATDGRLIRPVDQPTTAQVQFDWASINAEGITRRTELRQQKWQVKKRELELVASKNNLLPRLDASGKYRWLGAGDEFISSNRNGIPPFVEGSDAWNILTTGDYQEWELALQFSMPIGFRKALTGVRHQQLLLAKERAVLQDMELEVSHQLTDAVRDLDLNYGQTQTHFNRLVAAQDEVDAVEAVYKQGRVTLDQLLDAQRRRSEAEASYYRSLSDYNRAIMRVHWRKGSLLEYNGVYLSEGAWTNKAHFDALRRARKRGAQMHFDYGFLRPYPVTRGRYSQIQNNQWGQDIPDLVEEGEALQQAEPEGASLPQGEIIKDTGGATPPPVPMGADPQAATGLYPGDVEQASATVLVPLPPPVTQADYQFESPVAHRGPASTDPTPKYTSPNQPELQAWLQSTSGGLAPSDSARGSAGAGVAPLPQSTYESPTDHPPVEAPPAPAIGAGARR